MSLFAKSCLTVAGLLLLALATQAEPVAQLHATGYANDFARVLDQNTIAQIDDICRQIDQKAHAQIAVVTIHSTMIPISRATPLIYFRSGESETNRRTAEY
jgi:uncharacterized protein